MKKILITIVLLCSLDRIQAENNPMQNERLVSRALEIFDGSWRETKSYSTQEGGPVSPYYRQTVSNWLDNKTTYELNGESCSQFNLSGTQLPANCLLVKRVTSSRVSSYELEDTAHAQETGGWIGLFAGGLGGIITTAVAFHPSVGVFYLLGAWAGLFAGMGLGFLIGHLIDKHRMNGLPASVEEKDQQITEYTGIQ